MMNQNTVPAEIQYVLNSAIHFMKAEPREAVLKLLENGAGLEAGDPKGMEDAIRKLAKQYPDVVKIGIDGSDEDRANEYKNLTPQQYSERKEEVDSWLARQGKKGKS